MAWTNTTQATSAEGDVSAGILNDATGEFWYQRTDPESGQTVWRSTSGGISGTDPRGPDTLGGLLQYGNPNVSYGGEGGTTSIYTPNLESIGGNKMGDFQVRQVGPDQWQALNPKTGVWEQAYHIPESVSGNNVTIVPQSLASSIPGAAIFTNKPANNSGGFFEDFALPAIIGGIATAGVGSMLGAGSLFGGASSAPNLTGGLQDFMSADAASSAGLSSGGGMEFDSLFDEMFGPMVNYGGTQAPAGGLGPLDSLEEFFGPMGGGGTEGFTLDMSGHAIDAAGNVVNGTDGSIMDFMKGAIKSGNIEQLMKVLPSIPGGSTAMKALFGGGSGGSGLSSLFAPSGTGTGKYSTDMGGILNSLLGYQTNKDYQDKLIEVMNKSIEASDPFKTQRPFYQQQLQSMFTDPNYFNNNALLKGANDMAVNDTTRKMASQGYNMSGNVPMEVGQRLQQNNMGYAQKLMDFTGQAAGASINPSASGQVAATTGTAAANAGNAGNASLGNLFNTVWNGQQPSLADQYLGGANKNPNLGSVLFS